MSCAHHPASPRIQPSHQKTNGARMPEVHFLPWANIQQLITIGPVTITPWQTIRATLPNNARTFLDNYFNKYRTAATQPVQHIGIASITNNPIANITSEQRATIQQAVDAFSLASIIPSLRQTLITATTAGVPNAETFQLLTQRLGNYQSFVTISTRGMNCPVRLRDLLVLIPWEASVTDYQTDDELLAGLGKLLTGKRDKRLGESIFRTIEWFRLSNTGNPATSNLERVIMKATAFEVLLDPTGKGGKRLQMAQTLQTLTDTKKVKKRVITVNRTKHTVNALGAWLNAFYKLRNDIVHGDKISVSQLRYRIGTQVRSHLDIADLVLWEAITWTLFNRRYLGTLSRQAAHSFARALGKKSASPDLVNAHFTSHFEIARYHNTLGWRKKK